MTRKGLISISRFQNGGLVKSWTFSTVSLQKSVGYFTKRSDKHWSKTIGHLSIHSDVRELSMSDGGRISLRRLTLKYRNLQCQINYDVDGVLLDERTQTFVSA